MPKIRYSAKENKRVGTTAVAALREKRHFIGFELNEEYYKIALKRIEKEQQQLSFNF